MKYDKLTELMHEFWTQDGIESFSHLKDTDFKIGVEKAEKIAKNLHEKAFNKIDFKNKVLIDYGIGNGFIATLFFQRYGLRKFIGYDLSEKSIKATHETLRNCNHELIQSYNQDYKFSEHKADVFTSFACIQHFPTQEYLNSFLEQLNESNIPTILLQIRQSDETKFHKNVYTHKKHVTRACFTNEIYITNILSNYKNEHKSDINPKSFYQYLIYRKK